MACGSKHTHQKNKSMATEAVGFVVYANPKDYPDKYVIRRWTVYPDIDAPVPDLKPLLIADTLQECRDLLNTYGRMPIGRMEDDDPAIVGIWVKFFYTKK